MPTGAQGLERIDGDLAAAVAGGRLGVQVNADVACDLGPGDDDRSVAVVIRAG